MRALARRFGASPASVQKWPKRETAADAPMGPKRSRPSVLTSEEATVVALRRHAPPPLDDRLRGLRSTFPHLARSTVNRCLERHGTGRPPEVDEPARGRSRAYPVGRSHTEVGGAEGELRLVAAVDRTSEPASARLVEGAGKTAAARLLREPVEAAPHRVRAALTDGGVRPTPRRRGIRDGGRTSDRVRRRHGVEHRPTRIDHPRIAGRVERTNRATKDATVGRRHHDSRTGLGVRLQLFPGAYDHARRLETPGGPASREDVCRVWAKEPERFRLDPSRHVPGPYSPAPRQGLRRVPTCRAGSVEARR